MSDFHKTCSEIVYPGAFITSVDWFKMFYQLPTSRRTQMGSTAWVGGRRVRLHGAAMGISVIPSASQRISNILCALVAERCPWARTASCIDDLYQTAPSFLEGLMTIQALYDLCTRLRVQLKPIKCDHWPHTTKPILRNTVNTATSMVYTHADTQSKIRNKCNAFLDRVIHHKAVTMREVASLIGTVQSCSDSAWQVFMSLTGFRDLLQRMIRMASPKAWDAAFRLDMEAEWMVLADARRLTQIAKFGGRSMLPYIASEFCVTDGGPMASGGLALSVRGQAAIMIDAASTVPSNIAFRYLMEGWCQRLWSQNRKELAAATAAVESFVRIHNWHDCVVAVIVDSRTVRAYLTKGGPRIELAHAAARFHQRLWAQFRIRVVSLWSSGKSLFLADEWSRTKVNCPRWMESPEARRLIEHRLGPHTVDCFATTLNRWVERHISPYPEPSESLVAADFFSLNLASVLEGERPICRPPADQIMATLKAIRAAALPHFTLITWGMPPKPWVAEAVSMLAAWPAILPFSPGLFLPCWEPTQKIHERETWSAPQASVFAWPLSGQPSRIAAFQHPSSKTNWRHMPTAKVEELTTVRLAGSLSSSSNKNAVASLRRMLKSRARYYGLQTEMT